MRGPAATPGFSPDLLIQPAVTDGPQIWPAGIVGVSNTGSTTLSSGQVNPGMRVPAPGATIVLVSGRGSALGTPVTGANGFGVGRWTLIAAHDTSPGLTQREGIWVGVVTGTPTGRLSITGPSNWSAVAFELVPGMFPGFYGTDLANRQQVNVSLTVTPQPPVGSLVFAVCDGGAGATAVTQFLQGPQSPWVLFDKPVTTPYSEGNTVDIAVYGVTNDTAFTPVTASWSKGTSGVSPWQLSTAVLTPNVYPQFGGLQQAPRLLGPRFAPVFFPINPFALGVTVAGVFTASASDTSVTTDTAARDAQAFTRSASDTTLTTDTATRAAIAFARSTADTSNTSDTATRGALAQPRTASDASLTTDTATRAARTLTRSAADTSASSDAATRTFTLARAASDTSASSDTATRGTLSRSRTTSDTSATSDTATRAVLAFVRSTADSSNTSDTATRGALAQTRTGSDTSTTSDTATRARTFTRSTADTSTTTDAATRATMAFARAASDTSASTDTARVGALARSGTDTSTTSDTAVRFVAFARAASDTSQSSDAATRGAMAFTRTSADTSITGDTATRTTVSIRTAADVSLASDAASEAPRMARATTDITLTSDTATRLVSFARTAADTSLTGDSATVLLVASTVQACATTTWAFDAQTASTLATQTTALGGLTQPSATATITTGCD